MDNPLSSDDELELLDTINLILPATKCPSKRRNQFEEFDENGFKSRFRLSKLTCTRVLEEIEERLEYETDKNQTISPINQLLVTLRFLATGTFQSLIGDLFGIQQSTVCKIVQRVVPVIASLSVKYIRPIETLEEKINIMKLFFDTSGFPGIIGAVDCTHVSIFSPGGDTAKVFRNRNGYFSLNVQLVSAPSLCISDVVARWPGSVHDSTIFDYSQIRAKFESQAEDFGYLVGDSGYACRKYILTPVLDPTNSAEENYNRAHVQARNCIERANGVIKRRFPCLKYGLRVKTERVPSIIVATVVLHNIAVQLGKDEPPDDTELLQFILQKKSKMEFIWILKILRQVSLNTRMYIQIQQ